MCDTIDYESSQRKNRQPPHREIMSWSDIFYPDNPKRREEVIRLCTKLSVLMENNFESTNSLSDLLNEHASPSPPFEHIRVDPDADVETNSNVLITQMERIQKHVDEVDAALAQELDPVLYEKLKDINTSFSDKIDIAQQALTATITIVSSAASVALVGAMTGGYVLTPIVRSIGVVKASVVGTIGLGILTLGLDMIASAIIGAIEREKLDEAIDQLEEAVEEFDPTSKEYTKTILRVEVTIKVYFEDNQ